MIVPHRLRRLAALVAIGVVASACGHSWHPKYEEASFREQRKAAVAHASSACAAGDKKACSAACNALGPTSACKTACAAGDVAACDEGGSRLQPGDAYPGSDGLAMLDKGCHAAAPSPGVDRRWHACLVLSHALHAQHKEDDAKAAADLGCKLSPELCVVIRADASRAARSADMATPKAEDHEAARVRGYLEFLFKGADQGAFTNPETAYVMIAEDHARLAVVLPKMLGDDPRLDSWRVAYDEVDQLLRAPIKDRHELEDAGSEYLTASLDAYIELGRIYGLEKWAPPPAPAAR